MDVILINPNSRLINKSWGYRRFFNPIAPLGLCYIAALLREHGVRVSVVDQYATKAPDCSLIALIKKEKPLLVGFSAFTPIMPDIKRLVHQIHASGVDTKVVLGNIHATCFPEEVLRDRIADIIVRGEGEITMLELYNRIKRGESLEGLAGISFRVGENVINNPDRELINDINTLPLPAWDLLNLDNYLEVPLAAIDNALAMPILASRGCPYRCYYCSQDKIYNKVKYRDLNRVVEEMEYFHEKFNIRYFGFCDAYFPFDEKSGLEFCSLIVKHSLHRKLKWCTETRVDKVTPRLLQAMKEVGLHLIMYGVEVGNEKILKKLNKGTTLEQAKQAFKETRKAGILSLGLFILGLPGETEETCRETIRFAKSLDCDIAKFNTAVPYPGSKFFEDFIKEHPITKPEKFTSWYDWTLEAGELIYCPDGLNSETLRQLQRRAMLEFFMRPKIIVTRIAKGIIPFRNIFYGAIWLVMVFLLGIFKSSETHKKKKEDDNEIKRSYKLAERFD